MVASSTDWQAPVRACVIGTVPASSLVTYAAMVGRSFGGRVVTSIRQLAADVGRSLRAVRDALLPLEAAGLVTADPRADDRGRVWRVPDPDPGGRHARVPGWWLALPNLSAAAKACQIALASYADGSQVRVSRGTLARALGVDERNVSRALTALEQAGLQVPDTKPHSGSGMAVWRTLIYRNPRRDTPPVAAVNAPDGGGKRPPNQPLNQPKNQVPPPGFAAADSAAPLVNRKEPLMDEIVPTLPGMPPTPAKPPTAGDLVSAWTLGWQRTRSDRIPPAVMARVRGAGKRLGQHCADVEDWRTAWKAFHLAGQHGRYDPLPYFVQDVPTSMFTVPERPPTPGVADMLRRRAADQPKGITE